MNLDEARDEYYERSRVASEISRNLAFAGFGAIWVLKPEGIDKLPLPLMEPAFFFALALASDLLQYLWAASAWGISSRIAERKLPDVSVDHSEVEFTAWPCINVPTNILFGAKMIFVFAGYIAMLRYLS